MGDRHEVVGQHGCTDEHLEALESFGETALRSTASKEHRDTALDTGAETLSLLEGRAFLPLCAAVHEAQRMAFYPQSVGVIKIKDDASRNDASGKSRKIESWENSVQSRAAVADDCKSS